MSAVKSPILVFGATGQQGGSVADALLQAGWPVRGFTRDMASAKALALREKGAELVQGDFDDIDAIRAAMAGAHGVFSVQPSSPGGVVTDADETRYGITIADLSLECGVEHLVYSSTNALCDGPTGMGHFDSKGRIEAHLAALPIAATVVRPATFMEMLVMPGFGLDQGRFDFFLRPDQSLQVLAVEDIGKFVAAIFADMPAFRGETLEIASDEVTGSGLGAAFSEAAGRPIAYGRFSDALLASNPFLGKLTALLDDGRLTGRADLGALRRLNPQMQTLQSWLATTGRKGFLEALGVGGDWAYGQTRR